MEIATWITPDPAGVDQSSSILEAVTLMNERRIGAMLVMNGEDLVGIFTERDLLTTLAEATAVDGQTPVSLIMTRELITAQVSDDFNAVYALMRKHSIRHIPVLDGRRVVGIVSMRDLIHHYQNTLESEYAEARSRIDDLKRLVNVSTDNVIDSLFAQIKRYKKLSLTDHLTGLYNKRYFTMRMEEEIARAKRYGEDLSLIFCDIDHFKRINDDYGHSSGDQVLKELGKTLAGGMGALKVVSRLRKSDIIARYGGEEFVVILPETSAESACVAAEKMRATIEAGSIEINEDTVHVTMSFGVAGLSEVIKDSEAFIKRADHAMYRAKQNGRNRVEMFVEKDYESAHVVGR